MLNSTLIAFWLRYQGKMIGDLFQINKEQILQIPIKLTDTEIQEKIAKLVENLIEKYKLFQTNIDNCIEIIKLNYNIKKMPNNFKEFYKLGLNPFKDELANLGVEIGIDKIEALMSWYKDKSAMFLSLEKEITDIQLQIDKEIYKLYGLSDDEIMIVEKS